ncbi:Bacterial low temperature requirement A protein (LtrA) [Streptococcus constellatus]|uniref:Bacterial low temperature requirement A protein (LtrA) n=1 Tax=Streptococcus constellatus TaxID=76860 RepID=A0A564SJD5_STRCV|nr:low temperature requirement protein A [Streptococcus constellatus]VUW95285.1 Bacterial low temperature requirement A protein (LtrA) [Streptococcus constellatus]VUX05132.1 Bacterial low temperature requirement A protein (LtrA) [Streptococcus gordonii]
MSQHKSKRVSNYELFFDLAFVIAISQLTSAIHVSTVGFNEILSFIAGSIIMLNIWNNEAFYYNKYGDSRRGDIFTIIILMLLVGNLALNYNFDIERLRQDYSSVIAFNIFLALVYGVIAIQYYLKGRALGFNKDIKLSIVLLGIYILSVLPVAMGLIPYSHFILPFYLLPLILPIFIRSYSQSHFMNFPHALERNQLLTIITFGETVIAIIKTYPLAKSPLEGAALFFGMAGLFMFYMSQTFLNINHHRVGSTMQLFYAHAIIVISLLFFTVGLEFLVDHHHHEQGAIFLIVAIIGFYLGVLMTSAYNHELYRLNGAVLMRFASILTLEVLAFYLLRNHVALLGLAMMLMNYLMNRTAMLYRRECRERQNVPHPDPRQNL